MLTHTQKVSMVKSLAPHHKAKLRKHLRAHIHAGKGMSGAGLFSFLGSIGKTLLPIVKSVGLPILKNVLLPAVKGHIEKKYAGSGLKVPGGGLMLAGQRRRRR